MTAADARSTQVSTFRERKLARRARRARAVAGQVISGLDEDVPPVEIARRVGMGLRTLRHYLTRTGHDDVAIALQIRQRTGW